MAGLEAAFERIGAFLEQQLPRTHAAGAALAVTDRDEILGVVVRGFADVASSSPVRPETRFEIGSISKSFASMILLGEHAAGNVDLHVSVNELLPELDAPEPFGPITLHHLLSHTSGLPIGTEEAPTGPGALRRVRDMRPGFAPGEHFWYSNDGYKIVGGVIERLLGRPIHELLHERIFDPLGMTSTVGAITNEVRLDLSTGYEPLFDDRPPHTTHPLVPARWLVSNTADGSIVSNVVDMCAYARLLLNRGMGPKGPIVDEATFELLTTPVIQTSDPLWWYGYGLEAGEVDGRRVIGHSGGMVGYTGYLLTDPEAGIGAMMMLNGQGRHGPTVNFALAAVRAALGGDPLPEVESLADPTQVADAAAYTGGYRSGDRAIEIAADDGRLRWRDGALGVVLERVEDQRDTFFLPHPGLDRALVHFGRDADDRVVELTHGDEWLHNEAWRGVEPEPAPAAWSAFPGLYRGNNPWSPTLRVHLRRGRLVVVWTDDVAAAEEELVPMDDGTFHVGHDAWTPAWISFDQPMDGKTVRASLNGGVWYRSFEG